MRPLFTDRADAGRALAARLVEAGLSGALVVLALPRGGVPVAAEIARRLKAPLDLLLVRKIGAPGQPELAVAAVVDAATPEIVVDAETSAATGASADYIRRQADRARRELERRRRAYLGGREPLALRGATVVVVDDGIATGTTVRAALRAVRRRGADRIVLAVPVAPHQVLMALQRGVDLIVCLAEPEPFAAVGMHYADFRQVDDDAVVAALRDAGGAARARSP